MRRLRPRPALLPLAGLLAAPPPRPLCCDRGATAAAPGPRWLRHPRCAVPLRRGPAGGDLAADFSGAVGAVRAPLSATESPLTYVEATFGPPAGSGASVSVKRALVDTGSEDCELREGLLRGLQLGTTASRARYETVSGEEAYDVYELALTVHGRTRVVRVSVAPEHMFGAGEEGCSDDAIIGHAALAALGLLVDPAARRLVDPGELPAAGGQPRRAGLTYAEVAFRSTLPGGRAARVRALVDTGSSDCELSGHALGRLGSPPPPVISDRVVYETAVGGEPYTVFEVQLEVCGRACAAAATASLSPSDEPVLGHLALAALGLVVDPAGRRLLPASAPSQP